MPGNMPKKVIHNQDIVDEILDDKAFRKDLLYHEEYKSFFLWQGGWYKILSYDEFKATVMRMIKIRFPEKNCTQNLANDVVEHIRLICPYRTKRTSFQYIALKDQLLNTTTFELSPHDRTKTVLHHLPYTWQEIADTPTPQFQRFLETSLVTKKDHTEPDIPLITVAQEMYGYFLIGNMKNTVAWFLVGDGSNGKSVMLYTIEKMLGSDFCTAMSIQELTTDKFAPSSLVGKRINISNEEESKYMESSKFKALVTGDPIRGERKFQEGFTFRPQVKYVFATNAMPKFKGINYGLTRRMMILPFHRRFTKRECDYELTDKLVKELPGIVRFAVEGAKRLIGNHYQYTESLNIEASEKELMEEMSSSLLFFNERFEISKEAFMESKMLYAMYAEWTREVGKQALSLYNFQRELRLNIPGLEHMRQMVDGKRLHGYNVSYKQDPEADKYLLEQIQNAQSQDSLSFGSGEDIQ